MMATVESVKTKEETKNPTHDRYVTLPPNVSVPKADQKIIVIHWNMYQGIQEIGTPLCWWTPLETPKTQECGDEMVIDVKEGKVTLRRWVWVGCEKERGRGKTNHWEPSSHT
eukprot:TRINITY_DN3313_c0_g1_i1.p2 TRINITY_DN3313_c0_g1~~TRINITY_DN3313_c0_g1_i1.p2  ORF type:complete len:112 (+),score=21.40 TRINITY_DN3313_c0_g1_i1:248-583(+)